MAVIYLSMRKCQMCKGIGKIVPPKHKRDLDALRCIVNVIRKEGYSIRQIMRLLKYKSPRSVQDLLDTDQ